MEKITALYISGNKESYIRDMQAAALLLSLTRDDKGHYRKRRVHCYIVNKNTRQYELMNGFISSGIVYNSRVFVSRSALAVRYNKTAYKEAMRVLCANARHRKIASKINPERLILVAKVYERIYNDNTVWLIADSEKDRLTRLVRETCIRNGNPYIIVNDRSIALTYAERLETIRARIRKMSSSFIDSMLSYIRGVYSYMLARLGMKLSNYANTFLTEGIITLIMSRTPNIRNIEITGITVDRIAERNTISMKQFETKELTAITTINNIVHPLRINTGKTSRLEMFDMYQNNKANVVFHINMKGLKRDNTLYRKTFSIAMEAEQWI